MQPRQPDDHAARAARRGGWLKKKLNQNVIDFEAVVAALLGKDWDESKHPRVPAGSPEGGQFGEGGGGSAAAAEGAPKLDPKVVDVGGDSWNKSTAKRLEREYQAAKPKLDALNDNAVKESKAVHAISIGQPPGTADVIANITPKPWNELTPQEQAAVYSAWATHQLQSGDPAVAATWANLTDDEKANIAADMAKEEAKPKTPVHDWDEFSDHEKDSIFDTWNDQSDFDSNSEAAAAWDNMSDADKAKVAAELGLEPEEEEAFIPEEWDQMTGDQQSEVEENWKDSTFSEFLESEQNSFYENDGPDWAKDQVLRNYNDGSTTDWADEAIDDVMEEYKADETPIPYSKSDLIDAIKLGSNKSDDGWEIGGWKQELEVNFDDSKLQHPTDAPPPPDPNQPEFPGMPEKPAVDYSKHLTEDMRDRLTAAIEAAFEKEADHTEVTPPEYLEESAKEFQDQMWGEKDDEEKFEWAKKHTNILDEPTTGEPAGSDKPAYIRRSEVPEIDALPKNYDPLNNTSGTDYVRTQKLAKYLSVTRAVQILKERGIEGKASSGRPTEPNVADIAMMDNELWEGWKSSSTSREGRLLQVVTADELGGRMNKKTSTEIDRDAVIKLADEMYQYVGGYAGVKAYLRAKWETSQYLLDKAGEPELKLYRGYSDPDEQHYQKGIVGKHLAAADKVSGGYTRMTTLDVLRNGAVSTTTDGIVANHWKQGHSTNLILRALVPRTAALSIPAYGINIHSEHEVVIAGTAWKAWDVWAKKAPFFEEIPLKVAA